jgi:Zn-finger nucleic acid-binding protein
MKCPTDDTDLMMTERQGIEIDFCPKCRGVWLDRGELDKLIERSTEATTPKPPAPYREHDSSHNGGQVERDPRYYKKRKSLIGELFDF